MAAVWETSRCHLCHPLIERYFPFHDYHRTQRAGLARVDDNEKPPVPPALVKVILETECVPINSTNSLDRRCAQGQNTILGYVIIRLVGPTFWSNPLWVMDPRENLYASSGDSSIKSSTGTPRLTTTCERFVLPQGLQNGRFGK